MFNKFTITKDKLNSSCPNFEWTNKNGDLVFDRENTNFNTFVRAFSKNKLQWRYLEKKLCNIYNVDNGDVRIIDAFPDECVDDDTFKLFILQIWLQTKDIMKDFIH